MYYSIYTYICIYVGNCKSFIEIINRAHIKKGTLYTFHMHEYPEQLANSTHVVHVVTARC